MNEEIEFILDSSKESMEKALEHLKNSLLISVLVKQALQCLEV